MIVTRHEIGYTDMELTLRTVIREVSQERQGGWRDEQTERQMDIWVNGWMGQRDRQADRWMKEYRGDSLEGSV